MKFVKPKQRVKVATRDQGLRADNHVFIKGNKPSITESLAMLQRQDEEHGYDPEEDDFFRAAAGLSSKKKKKNKKKTKKKKQKTSKKRRDASVSPSPDNHRRMQKHHRRASLFGSGPSEPVVPRKAPMVSDSSGDEGLDSIDGLSDMSGGSGLDDLDSGDDGVSSILSGFSSASSLNKRKGMGPRKIDIDDSMSIISDDLDSVLSGTKTKPKASAPSSNMFSGLSKKEAEEAEKNDLLARFHILKQRGVHLSKNFSNKSSLNEMRMEMGRIEHESRVERSVQINRRWFLAGASALSKVTDNYAPSMVRGKWHGFDKYVLNSINDYDAPFERLSEHYGGVVSALTGGNPLWEILVLFAYQFVVYGFMTNGASQAKANEDLTIDDVQRRYPLLIKEAVEKELKRRREEEQMNLRQAQFEQRAQFNAFDAQQHMAAAAHHTNPNPNTFIRPPPSQFTQFYPPPAPQQQYQQDQPPPPPPLPQVPPTLNAENPSIQQRPSMNQHVPQPQHPHPRMESQFSPDLEAQKYHHQEQRVFMPPQVTIMHTNDPYLFNEMHAALPHIDPRPTVVAGDSANIEILSDDSEDINDYEIDDILDNPISTREGRPHSMNTPPPNKRDMAKNDSTEDTNPAEIPLPKSPTTTKSHKPPFGVNVTPEQIKANRESGYVINIT